MLDEMSEARPLAKLQKQMEEEAEMLELGKEGEPMIDKPSSENGDTRATAASDTLETAKPETDDEAANQEKHIALRRPILKAEDDELERIATVSSSPAR